MRRLFCVYKQGFATLATVAGVASAIPDDPNSSKLWTVYEKIRTEFQR